MKVNLTPEHRKLIKSRIRDYRKYDVKRWGASVETITYEQYLEKIIEQQGKCYWTGRDMSIGCDQTTEASLDRLHCDRPHTDENTILCQRALNLGRNDSSILEWVTYLDMLGILAPEHQTALAAYTTSNQH